MFKIILEALMIGLKIYFAAKKAGKQEVVSEIKKNLDELQKLPVDEDALRMQHAARLSLLMRNL
jgi:hypothetical protein